MTYEAADTSRRSLHPHFMMPPLPADVLDDNITEVLLIRLCWF